MVSFDLPNRTYMRNQFLMGQIIDIEIQKTLPTSNIERVYTDANNISNKKELKQHYISLSEGQDHPVKV
jgi:hypothetical protein